ncbi:MAG: DUF1844 domain-containing protein [Planctomycetota bacterium]|jgi:hypothetical protein
MAEKEKEKKEEKKIIVDEDWKQEAQKEKDILTAQEKSAKEKPEEEKPERGPLPKGDLAALISMLVTQAFYSLGAIKMEGQEKEPDLELARYNIDMLETLAEKTKGNLNENEEKVLANTLNQVRMAYVKVSE